MKAWKIQYTIQDWDDTFDRVAYLESETPPTAEERLECILEEQAIDDDNPMASYNTDTWVYDHDGNRIEILDYEQVPTQRLVRIWHEAGGVYVGDHDCVLRRFPVADDGADLMRDLSLLLRNLGYVVSVHAQYRRWVDRGGKSMLYVMGVSIEDGEQEYGEDVHFASTPQAYLGDAASEFLDCFAGKCPYCKGDSLCADCRDPYYGGAIRAQFLKSDGKLIVHIPADHRSFLIRIKPVEPVRIHLVDGRVAEVSSLPRADWPWEAMYE